MNEDIDQLSAALLARFLVVFEGGDHGQVGGGPVTKVVGGAVGSPTST